MQRFLLLMVSGFMISASTVRADLVVANASFESPNLSGSYEYQPSLAQQGGTGWTFGGNAGIAANGSGFGIGIVFDGNQAAFIQGSSTATSYMEQTVGGFSSGSYAVSFYASGRAYFLGEHPFVVEIDGIDLSFQGTSVINPTNGIYNLYTSDPIALTAGAHTLLFDGAGTQDGNYTSFVDDVSITPSAVPEPASLLMLGTGLVGGFGFLRGRRSARTKVSGA